MHKKCKILSSNLALFSDLVVFIAR